MRTNIAIIADAIVDEINNANRRWSQAFTAERIYLERITSRDSKTMQARVRPVVTGQELIARGIKQRGHQIEIAFRKVVNHPNVDAVDALSAVVQQVADYFGADSSGSGHRKIAGTNAYVVQGVTEPIFFPDLLEEEKMFLSILSLSIIELDDLTVETGNNDGDSCEDGTKPLVAEDYTEYFNDFQTDATGMMNLTGDPIVIQNGDMMVKLASVSADADQITFANAGEWQTRGWGDDFELDFRWTPDPGTGWTNGSALQVEIITSDGSLICQQQASSYRIVGGDHVIFTVDLGTVYRAHVARLGDLLYFRMDCGAEVTAAITGTMYGITFTLDAQPSSYRVLELGLIAPGTPPGDGDGPGEGGGDGPGGGGGDGGDPPSDDGGKGLFTSDFDDGTGLTVDEIS